ncbi:hypothetical protein T01_3107 [Trichinella spiralis]|uniref:Uncharacterized protein n=1 Tax=Trichinella spiralis TaxID=6334 RepID=A0A0V1BYE6_TRISP|nr:hypothetical protein T01_3107 [Trichinella spiralis]
MIIRWSKQRTAGHLPAVTVGGQSAGDRVNCHWSTRKLGGLEERSELFWNQTNQPSKSTFEMQDASETNKATRIISDKEKQFQSNVKKLLFRFYFFKLAQAAQAEL